MDSDVNRIKLQRPRVDTLQSVTSAIIISYSVLETMPIAGNTEQWLSGCGGIRIL